MPNEKSVFTANRSQEDWIINKIEDSIIISLSDYNYFKGDSLPFSNIEIAEKFETQNPIRAVKKVVDGYIIGLNKGEFGGGLWFLSSDGKIYYEISPYKRVRQIFEMNNKIYVIEGRLHLTSDSGRLSELNKNVQWQISKTLELPNAPIFMIMDENNALILTTNNIVSFSPNERLEKILNAPFNWGMLYPSTAIIEKTDLYIAMRKGVLKVLNFRDRPEYEWYIKK